MSLASLRNKVASVEQIAAEERERKIAACFRPLPIWNEDNKVEWMRKVLLKLEDEASQGKTKMTLPLAYGASEFYHDWQTDKKEKGPEVPHGLWRIRDQSCAVDNFMPYLGWLREFDFPESVPGFFFFLQDVKIKIYNNLRGQTQEKEEAQRRLQEIAQQVQSQFMSFWIAHSDIPIISLGSNDGECSPKFRFDWAGTGSTSGPAEPYEVKRAREDVVKYQEKLHLAVEQLQSVRKRCKKTE